VQVTTADRSLAVDPDVPLAVVVRVPVSRSSSSARKRDSSEYEANSSTADRGVGPARTVTYRASVGSSTTAPPSSRPSAVLHCRTR
jgi:hypothetical protein